MDPSYPQDTKPSTYNPSATQQGITNGPTGTTATGHNTDYYNNAHKTDTTTLPPDYSSHSHPQYHPQTHPQANAPYSDTPAHPCNNLGGPAPPPGTSHSTSTAPRPSESTTLMSRPPRSTSSFSASDVLLCVLALFLPPVTVFLKRGLHVDFCINVCLCILAWFPGVLHAFYVVFKYRDGPGGMVGRGPGWDGGRRKI